ncbi:uncharacterized protein PAN0_002d0898 [Moesziomyces antarcticus]|uniref:uncharacterized protein n=1 Tax=Pseudozyma antarctica TaxID=84753 RepID=UPI00071983CB|nr:uncharacterized protein PAN0_002d0898 [Moesziomyces antarcticus]GAK62696.1 hypothetical protein PAN0_002d0898 [Moesziomyces antarcticus]
MWDLRVIARASEAAAKARQKLSHNAAQARHLHELEAQKSECERWTVSVGLMAARIRLSAAACSSRGVVALKEAVMQAQVQVQAQAESQADGGKHTASPATAPLRDAVPALHVLLAWRAAGGTSSKAADIRRAGKSPRLRLIARIGWNLA